MSTKGKELGVARGKQVLLKEGRDFTLTTLTNELNRLFKPKRGEEKLFNTSKVQGYVRAKRLPDIYGGYELKKMKNKRIGVSYIQVCKIL